MDTLTQNPTVSHETPEPRPSAKTAVERWLAKISAAERKHMPDFKRMEEDIDFAAGFQRKGQEVLCIDEYIVNLVIRNINQKVAALYARNPKAEWQRRPRLDFQIWDEKIESLMPLIQKTQAGIPLEMNEMALVQDYIHGMQFRAMLDRVGKTLEHLYQYEIDEHDPDFKLQLKALVRRVCTTGVGYCRVGFERNVETTLRSDGLSNEFVDMARRAQLILQRLEEEGADDSDHRYEQLSSLFASLQLSMSGQVDNVQTDERLVFDFLPSTSVIPDINCRSLKGFVGARWIAIKRTLPLEEVAAFFEKPDLKSNGKIKLYHPGGTEVDDRTRLDSQQEVQEPSVCVYEVLNKSDKTQFFLCEGYEDFLQEPAPLDPEVGGFWNIFALTFNDVETEPGRKASIFPPSDVHLMRPAQKEWNRTREELRSHRKANAPLYVTIKGWLTETDKAKIVGAEPNEVIELEGLPPNGDVSKAIAAMPRAAIEESLYGTDPYMQDILMSVGAQEANIGPANPDTTATGQTIAEQSRTLGLGSNIDDLDDFLSAIAKAAGDISLQSFSIEHVKNVVGQGAVWPETPELRENFLNEIFLEIVAASSGRPNRALDIANWERVAQILSQAGANPMFMVRETLKRLDDRTDVSEAFPLQPSATMGTSQPQSGVPGQVPPQGRPGPGKTGPRQPQQKMASEQAVPLAGA